MPEFTFDRIEMFPRGEACFVFVSEDGAHRQTVEPTLDLPSFPSEVPSAALAALNWTEQSVAAWRAEHYPPATLEQLRDAKRLAAITEHAARFGAGFVVPTGPLAGRLLQTATPANISDWSLSWTKYHLLVAAGQGSVQSALFRDADNVSTEITYADGAAVLDAMLAWGEAMRRHLWGLKDAIDAAESAMDLDAIDLAAPWPTPA